MIVNGDIVYPDGLRSAEFVRFRGSSGGCSLLKGHVVCSDDERVGIRKYGNVGE